MPDSNAAGDAGDSDDTRAVLRLVQQWAQRNLPAPESGHGGPECQWCPLCQLASMLRGENPEVADKLVEAGAALAAAARALLDSGTWRPPGATASSAETAADVADERPRPGRVQPIVLDDDAPDSDDPGDPDAAAESRDAT